MRLNDEKIDQAAFEAARDTDGYGVEWYAKWRIGEGAREQLAYEAFARRVELARERVRQLRNGSAVGRVKVEPNIWRRALADGTAVFEVAFKDAGRSRRLKFDSLEDARHERDQLRTAGKISRRAVHDEGMAA